MKAEQIISKYGLDKTTWTSKGFHGIPFTFYYVGNTAFEVCKSYFGVCCEKSMWFASKDYIYWYWPDDDMRKLRQRLLSLVEKDAGFLGKLRKDWTKRLCEFDSLLAKLDCTDLALLSDRQLFALYDEFYDKYLGEFGMVMAPGDAFSMYSPEFLEPAFLQFFEQKQLIKQFKDNYSLLFAPVEDSFITLEQKSKLGLLAEARKSGYNSKKFRQMLTEHQAKYFWIRNNYAKQPVLDGAFFLNEVRQLDKEVKQPEQELRKMENELAQAKSMKKKLIASLQLPKLLVDYIRIAEAFSYIQDERKKYVLIANHYIRRYIDDISRRRRLPVKLVEYMSYPETKLAKVEALPDRQEFCLFFQKGHGYHIFSGKEAARVHEILFSSKAQEITELKGIGASSGRQQGRVKIVLKTHDLVNFKQGDVLVASMTRPEMVVAMKKAAAIVTDEGGITSHAAIVSRELGIPCVIATKHATKIFKDGDLVEVDADRGTVRKLG